MSAMLNGTLALVKRCGELQAELTRVTAERNECRQRAESAEADRACLEKLVVRISKYPMHRAEELSAATIRKMALETLAQINAARGKCEHGNGLTDYCLPCGRVNGGG